MIAVNSDTGEEANKRTKMDNSGSKKYEKPVHVRSKSNRYSTSQSYQTLLDVEKDILKERLHPVLFRRHQLR